MTDIPKVGSIIRRVSDGKRFVVRKVTRKERAMDTPDDDYEVSKSEIAALERELAGLERTFNAAMAEMSAPSFTATVLPRGWPSRRVPWCGANHHPPSTIVISAPRESTSSFGAAVRAGGWLLSPRRAAASILKALQNYAGRLMANIAPAGAKAMLDWSLLGADPVRPSTLWIGLSQLLPNSTSAFEIGAGSGYSRQQVIFDAAATPVDDYVQARNANAMTFGPFSSAVEFVGYHLWDAQIAGHMLMYGSLQQGAAAQHGTAKLDAGVVLVTLG